MLHKNFESYVDYFVVKFKKRGDHVQDLHMISKLLQRFQLNVNPLKCVFCVTSKKFLRFIVHHRGIECGQLNIKAFQEMPKA